MSANVFINYRRDGTAGIAGRLYDRLTQEFGKETVFMDVDAMKPGIDFVKQLDEQIANCGILIAVIGPNWAHAKDDSGQPRLQKPHDYVRAEIASALKRDIPVVPVLLDGATMPGEGELPDDLKALTRRHAVELRHSRFIADAQVIVDAVKAVLPVKAAPSKRLMSPLATFASAVVVLGLAAGAVWQFDLMGGSRTKVEVASPPAAPAPVGLVSKPPETAAPKKAVEPPQWRAFSQDLKLDRARPDETVKRPWVGIQVNDLTPELASILGLTWSDGAVVSSVLPDSPAAVANLEAGDIVTGIARRYVKSARDITTIVSDQPFGTKVGLNVWRMGNGAADFNDAIAKAAEKGNVRALTEYGMSYYLGRGVRQDYITAKQWFEKAAAKGDGLALVKLGGLFAEGKGVGQDWTAAREWYQKGADAGAPAGAAELGGIYHYGYGVAADFAKAREWYEKAGDTQSGAQLGLGNLYMFAKGVPQDYVKAAGYFEKSAAKGNTSAMTRLAELARKNTPPDYAKAREWLEKAANLRDTGAMSDLGTLYYNGTGTPVDYVKAREWYERAADTQVTAMSNLGLIYAGGLGVPQDYPKAKELFEKAAARGDAPAMREIAKLYRDGHGVPKEPAVARTWFEKAAAKNDISAMAELGRLYQFGTGVTQDYAKAREWFEKSGETSTTALNGLASLYQFANGVTQDYGKARELFEKAAANDSAFAMGRLGDFNTYGYGVPKDYDKARQWYEKAAAKNDTNAQSGLGWLYYKGLGVTQDYNKSRQWYDKAALQGDTYSMSQLGVLYHNGFGVTQDYAKAKEWYEKAGTQSVALANLGQLYAGGLGVAKDETKARSYFEQAVSKGSNFASYQLALFLSEGKGGPADTTRAARQLLASAKGGHEFARKQLLSDMAGWNVPTRIALQQELKNAGVYQGATDGTWGAASQKAAEAYWAGKGN